jgi:type I restriction enzyme S subunit
MTEEWISNVPNRWPVVPFGSIFKQQKKKNTDLQRNFVLSVMKDKGVIPYSEKGNVGNKVSEDLSGYKIVDAGDFVLNSMNLFMGSVGVSKYDGITSTAYIVCRPSKDIDGHFYNYIIQCRGFQEYVGLLGKGIMEIREAVRWNALKSVQVPLPDLPTQRAIADFLDRETARIDLLIEKKEKMVEVLGVRIEAIIDMGLNGAHWLRFENVSQEMNRPITIGTNSLFEPLGLYNRGRGFFRKQESEDSDLGDSDFSYVKKGDLVFSGQFAWEGAVGFVFDEFDSCVVSHRYPIFTGNSGVSSEYLYAYFRSHHGRFLMDNCSRGAAGRNRPLNVNVLKKQKIAIASTEIQLSAAKAIYQEYGMKKVITKSVSMLTEYRSSLITAAVTGQIDINDWQKSGAGDRRLDALQERLPA